MLSVTNLSYGRRDGWRWSVRVKVYPEAIGCTVFLITAVLLAACGGGGASSTPSMSGGMGGSSAATSVATQRNVAGSALASVSDGVDFDEWGPSGGISSLALQDAVSVESVHTQSTGGTCQNGVEFSQSSTGEGQVTQTIEIFYDQSCTEPFKLITQTITFSSSGGSVQGSEEVWDQAGSVVAYKTYSLAFTLSSGHVTSIVAQKSVAPAPSASPLFQVGESCVFGTSNPIDCGAGNVLTISQPSASPSPLDESIGFAGTATGTFVTPSPSPSATPPSWGQPNELQIDLNGTGYTGAVGALTLASSTLPAWTISGGTQVLTLTGTVTLGFGGPEWGGGAMSSISLDESALGLTVTLTSSKGGKLSGNVTNASGTVVATMSLDYSGTGTITYSNGTTAQVIDWIILG